MSKPTENLGAVPLGFGQCTFYAVPREPKLGAPWLWRSVLNVTEAIASNAKTHTLMAYDKFVIKAPGANITLSSGTITLEASTINLKGNVPMGGGGEAQVPTLQSAANDGLSLVEDCLAQSGDK